MKSESAKSELKSRKLQLLLNKEKFAFKVDLIAITQSHYIKISFRICRKLRQEKLNNSSVAWSTLATKF